MSLPLPDQIRAASNELNELNRKLLASFPERGQQWRDLCEEFHHRYDQLFFPGGAANLRKVRDKDAVAIESAVRFLIVDPYHFRSGYTKEQLWRWLVHIPVSPRQRTTLEQAALQYIDRKISREFWSMAKAMQRIAGPTFWLAVANRAASAEAPERSRALLMLLFGTNVQAGALARRRIFHQWLMENYGGR